MYPTVRVTVLLRYVTLALLLAGLGGGPAKREDLFWFDAQALHRAQPEGRASCAWILYKNEVLWQAQRKKDAPDQPVLVRADHDDQWQALFEPGDQVLGHVQHGRRQTGCAGTGAVWSASNNDK